MKEKNELVNWSQRSEEKKESGLREKKGGGEREKKETHHSVCLFSSL